MMDERLEEVLGKSQGDDGEEAMKRCAVNLKCFSGVEWENISVKG